jgi:uncharacterized protein
MQAFFHNNRERALTFFLFCAMLTVSACGPKADETQDAISLENADVYTLEVMKDRLEKDKYFLSSPDTPIKASELALFKGLAYFPVDKSFAFPVVLKREALPEEIVMATSTGKSRPMLRIGQFDFVVDGIECTLQVYAPKDSSDGYYWFIPFTDLTNGESSYEAGRYLDIDDTSSDSTFLDFNYAYSPYCAYNDRYDCPIPPMENALKVAITAGEKNYPLRYAR